MRRRSLAVMAILSLLASVSCGQNSSNVTSGRATDSTLTGSLTSSTVSSLIKSGLSVEKTITHVLAVSPKTSNPESYVAAIASDGTFKLPIHSGQPYIIVFVSQDGVLKGSEMITGIVKVNDYDLDAFAVSEAANIDLGDVSMDGATATISTSTAELLDSLGITPTQAGQFGQMDDLSLRLSNPDIDGNGIIDVLEGKRFMLDWHVRAISNFTFDDIEGAFPNPTLTWILASGYALYSNRFDSGTYVDSNTLSLINGAAFSHAGSLVTPSSYTPIGYSDIRGWGPDYNLTAQEMGASDNAATFVYTMGSKKLTFTNVRTKTKAALNANGVLLPLIKVNTSAGKVTGIDYKWVIRSGGSWVDTTAGVVEMLAQEDSARLNFYTEKNASVEHGIYFNIPTNKASGTINIGDAAFSSIGVADVTALELDDFCSSALSYDDKIGLRIFAGAPRPNAGITPCD